tara:strand:- start:427 stop:1311 length:885 start_codon:yes stop_codon:yes gene_type:complete
MRESYIHKTIEQVYKPGLTVTHCKKIMQWANNNDSKYPKRFVLFDWDRTISQIEMDIFGWKNMDIFDQTYNKISSYATLPSGNKATVIELIKHAIDNDTVLTQEKKQILINRLDTVDANEDIIYLLGGKIRYEMIKEMIGVLFDKQIDVVILTNNSYVIKRFDPQFKYFTDTLKKIDKRFDFDNLIYSSEKIETLEQKESGIWNVVLRSTPNPQKKSFLSTPSRLLELGKSVFKNVRGKPKNKGGAFRTRKYFKSKTNNGSKNKKGGALRTRKKYSKRGKKRKIRKKSKTALIE